MEKSCMGSHASTSHPLLSKWVILLQVPKMLSHIPHLPAGLHLDEEDFSGQQQPPSSFCGWNSAPPRRDQTPAANPNPCNYNTRTAQGITCSHFSWWHSAKPTKINQFKEIILPCTWKSPYINESRYMDILCPIFVPSCGDFRSELCPEEFQAIIRKSKN